MQPRSVFRGTIAFVLVVVAASLVAVGWLWSRSPLVLMRHEMAQPEIVRFIPKRAIGFALLDAELPQLERLRQFVTPPSQRRRAHRQWRRALMARGEGAIATWLQAGNIEFERDIQSWLGSTSLIAELTSSSRNTPDYVLVLSTDDVHQSSRILNAWWQELYLQGKPPKNETYKGVQLFQLPLNLTQKDENERFQTAAAVGDRYVAFASSADAMRDAIDSWQIPELSLASNPHYRSVSARLTGNSLGWAYVNVPRTERLAAPETQSTLVQSPDRNNVSALGLSYRLVVGGSQIRTVMLKDNTTIASEFEPVEHLPGILFSLAAQEPRSLWLQVRQSISHTEDTSSLIQVLDRDLGRLRT
ncbi:MAG: DUF3352 domain-containing protein [Cyanobacteria bacterium J06642_2]